MKKLLLLLLLFITTAATAQVTYLADTALTTDEGYDGAPASCVYTGGTYTGLTMDKTAGIWVADAFTVPQGALWTLDTVILYGIQRFSGTTSSFTSCNLQLFNAVPGTPTSLIWGDTTTNCLVSTGFTGIYRVATDATGGLDNTLRPIMYLKLRLSPAAVLTAGTYWLAWSSTGTLSDTYTTGCPPKVLPGRINPFGQQGMQYNNNEWYHVADNGQPIGFSKILKSKGHATGITNIGNTPSAALGQNVPNPFDGSTLLSFYMPQAGYAKLCVYNTIGQPVATLFDGDAAMGQHQLTFSAGTLPAGMYYCQLTTNAGTQSRQMLLVK